MSYASRKRDTRTRRDSLRNLLVVGLALLRARGLFTVSESLRKELPGSQGSGWDDL